MPLHIYFALILPFSFCPLCPSQSDLGLCLLETKQTFLVVGGGWWWWVRFGLHTHTHTHLPSLHFHFLSLSPSFLLFETGRKILGWFLIFLSFCKLNPSLFATLFPFLHFLHFLQLISSISLSSLSLSLSRHLYPSDPFLTATAANAACAFSSRKQKGDGETGGGLLLVHRTFGNFIRCAYVDEHLPAATRVYIRIVRAR